MKLAERIAEYEAMFGHPPNRQALCKPRKRVTVETRAAKRKPARHTAVKVPRPRMPARRLTGWPPGEK